MCKCMLFHLVEVCYNSKMLTLDEFIKEFHIMLNDQQLAAVQAIEEPTLLLAVPGSEQDDSPCDPHRLYGLLQGDRTGRNIGRYLQRCRQERHAKTL